MQVLVVIKSVRRNNRFGLIKRGANEKKNYFGDLYTVCKLKQDL